MLLLACTAQGFASHAALRERNRACYRLHLWSGGDAVRPQAVLKKAESNTQIVTPRGMIVQRKGLRSEFWLKSDDGYPKEVGMTFGKNNGNPWESPSLQPPSLSSPVPALTNLSEPRKRSQLPVDMSNVYTPSLMGSPQSAVRVVMGVVPAGAHIFWKIKYCLRKSLLTLADCEWRAAALGLKPICYPRVRPSTSAVFSSLWTSSGIHRVCYLKVFHYGSVPSAQKGRLEAWIGPGSP